MIDEGHEHCPERLRNGWIAATMKAARFTGSPLEGNVIISLIRVVAPSFPEEQWRCPHGVSYWIAPDARLQRWLHDLPEPPERG